MEIRAWSFTFIKKKAGKRNILWTKLPSEFRCYSKRKHKQRKKKNVHDRCLKKRRNASWWFEVNEPNAEAEVRGCLRRASYWSRYRSSAGGRDKPPRARTESPGSHSRQSDWRRGWLASGSWLSGGAWWPGAAGRGNHSRWRSWRAGQRWTRSGGNWPPSWPECGPSSCEETRERRRCHFLILTRAAEVKIESAAAGISPQNFHNPHILVIVLSCAKLTSPC